jgi:hypothetical protein
MKASYARQLSENAVDDILERKEFKEMLRSCLDEIEKLARSGEFSLNFNLRYTRKSYHMALIRELSNLGYNCKLCESVNLNISW